MNPSQPQSPWDIEPSELKARMDANESFTLLDVREPDEYEFCNLGGKLIPLGELPTRHAELDPKSPIVVHCKMGGRSARATEYLRGLGFENVQNLRGGINAWSHEIDETIPKY